MALFASLQRIARNANPVTRWTRDRLWDVYDRLYEPLFGHADVHRAWLTDAGLMPGVDSLLSIGPGRGELELILCREFGCKFGYVEVFPRYYEYLESRFAEAGLKGAIVERRQGAYQNYEPQQRYQLILAVHSWYSFGYDAEVLRRTLSALAPRGSFVLTITAQDDFFLRSGLRCQSFSAEELSGWATENGFEHEFHSLKTSVPANLLVADGALTESAIGAISFLKGRLWWQIPRQERHRISEFMTQLSPDANVERIYGLLHFRAPEI